MGAVALGEARVDRVRAFFALPLPEAHRESLRSYLHACAQVVPEFSWTAAENLHLTVRFLGSLERAVAESIADRVENASPSGFDLALGEIGSFKRGRLARVVWQGLREGAAEIAPLAELLEVESVRAGLEPEGRRYHAHLTLARARSRDGAVLPDLPAPPALATWRAGELILFQSHLGRGGSVYEALRVITLR